ncbi:peptidylprolyl isomerase [Tamlana sp. 2_MG-2023]|uniref:peptidylprolyl isomerase n=1 Tax=unclassified Tamlana TaxID=2614803 RepID=UPI0026E1F194|nr:MULTISPECIES: peptidylprolyl isomerase [unclassified Tamlana]MDO6761294.1 peptidylprolyl isomerase [Tamlana sp. 2_MG-2023]MDO6791777.1 peptidylprolyl isomerase [Tamlana sp. 1_MG-2023]
MKKPIVHILIFGSLLALILLIVFGSKLPSQSDKRIIIDDSDFAQMLASWEKTWQRPPTKEEFNGILKSYVQDQVVYREALNQDLDKNNAMVKRSLIMQMDMLAESQGNAEGTSQEALEAYYELRKDKYLKPAEFSFYQIYFSTDKHGNNTEKIATNALNTIKNKQLTTENVSEFGDPIMLEHDYKDYNSTQINKVFGEGFSKTLENLDANTWSGPITSTYGKHLIYLSSKQAPTALPLEAVKDELLRDLQYEERNATKEQFFTELMQEYDVIYEGEIKSFLDAQ